MTDKELKKKADEIITINKKKADVAKTNGFYSLNSMLGNTWAMYYVILGSRGVGKSYGILEFFIKHWIKYGTPFVWIRLTAQSRDKMMANNGHDLIDWDLREKYGLEIKCKGSLVYDVNRSMETPMCRVLAISEAAKEKGVALFNKNYQGYYHICVDEFQREEGEVKRFNIPKLLSICIENLVRDRKKKVRIFMVANITSDDNEVMVDKFRFIPEIFGRYYIKSKRMKAVIDYIPPNIYTLTRRDGTAAEMMDGDSSNFTNTIVRDKSMIYKGARKRCDCVIKFGKEKDKWFTLWDGNIISMYNNQTLKNVISMKPYINEVFYPELRDNIIEEFDYRLLRFHDYVTLVKFEKELKALKPRGADKG